MKVKKVRKDPRNSRKQTANNFEIFKWKRKKGKSVCEKLPFFLNEGRGGGEVIYYWNLSQLFTRASTTYALLPCDIYDGK